MHIVCHCPHARYRSLVPPDGVVRGLLLLGEELKTRCTCLPFSLDVCRCVPDHAPHPLAHKSAQLLCHQHRPVLGQPTACQLLEHTPRAHACLFHPPRALEVAGERHKGGDSPNPDTRGAVFWSFHHLDKVLDRVLLGLIWGLQLRAAQSYEGLLHVGSPLALNRHNFFELPSSVYSNLLFLVLEQREKPVHPRHDPAARRPRLSLGLFLCRTTELSRSLLGSCPRLVVGRGSRLFLRFPHKPHALLQRSLPLPLLPCPLIPLPLRLLGCTPPSLCLGRCCLPGHSLLLHQPTCLRRSRRILGRLSRSESLFRLLFCPRSRSFSLCKRPLPLFLGFPCQP
mmetsp:Transcript_34569/g.84096  ORF Transcript_34569/g.84096 Transcript_34569/m.84096 type:complete len:340 (+) Transcript_34569:339-1358(+)